MKNKITTFVMAILAMILTACTQNGAGPTVTPPSWKGFNYVVKKAVGNEYEFPERIDIKPGDDIKVYAVRKNPGVYLGKITGTIYVRWTAYMKSGAPQTGMLDKSAESPANAEWDGWEDPYATFAMPELNGEYDYYMVEAACQLHFKAFGNQNSNVDYSDQTNHEDPYIGNIYTDYNNFHPMNGGAANSGKNVGEENGLKYHLLYRSK